jgi:hypothetical protein
MSRARFLKLLRRALIGAAVVLAVLANAIGLATIVIDHARPFDWDNYVEAARRFPLGTMYNWHYPYGYHYAPQLAPVLGALSAMGITAWRVLHLAALPFLPSRKLAVLLLVSYPFWSDINTGNLMIFVLLAATWAFRGNSVATGVYLALCVLIPRPIMLPLLAWLLWQRPAWRLPFAGMAVLVVITAIPTGYLPDWIGSFVASGVRDVANDFNLSPSRFIGPAWLAIGIPLAAWLTIRGRLGWASMAISPYLLPYWVQMLGLELVRPAGQPRDLTAAPPPTGSPGTTSPPAAAPGT